MSTPASGGTSSAPSNSKPFVRDLGRDVVKATVIGWLGLVVSAVIYWGLQEYQKGNHTPLGFTMMAITIVPIAVAYAFCFTEANARIGRAWLRVLVSFIVGAPFLYAALWAWVYLSAMIANLFVHQYKD